MPPNDPRIAALRSSQDRFAALVTPLDEAALGRMSYAPDWTVAAVASHLGSQAEVFDLFLEAGLTGGDPPGIEQFRPIWDRWNALPPIEQRDGSVAGNEALVQRLEGLTDADWAIFDVEMFGGKPNVGELAGFRLTEHVLHTWDIAVTLDPSARLADDAVAVLIDFVERAAPRSVRPESDPITATVQTTDPSRQFQVSTGDPVTVSTLETDEADDGDLLRLPAEAFIRLIYGRLDPATTPAGVTDPRLERLESVFQGY